MNECELKPCPCETGEAIISKDVISGNMLQWMGNDIGQDKLDAAEYELCVFIDSRGFIQLADKDDHNCIDHGYAKKINFCPLCGKSFHGSVLATHELGKLLDCPCEKESAEECSICRDLDTRKSMISMEDIIRGIDKVGFNVETRVRLIKAIQEEGGLL